jgi:Fe-S-cluster formation regulator IscX/YfhJ
MHHLTKFIKKLKEDFKTFLFDKDNSIEAIQKNINYIDIQKVINKLEGYSDDILHHAYLIYNEHGFFKAIVYLKSKRIQNAA